MVPLAKPPHIVGFVIVLVVPIYLGGTTELTAAAFEQTDPDGVFILAPAPMSVRKPGNGLPFVAVVILADAAFPSWIVRSTTCVGSVLVQAKPAGNVAGSCHKGFAAPALTDSFSVPAHTHLRECEYMKKSVRFQPLAGGGI